MYSDPINKELTVKRSDLQKLPPFTAGKVWTAGGKEPHAPVCVQRLMRFFASFLPLAGWVVQYYICIGLTENMHLLALRG